MLRDLIFIKFSAVYPHKIIFITFTTQKFTNLIYYLYLCTHIAYRYINKV